MDFNHEKLKIAIINGLAIIWKLLLIKINVASHLCHNRKIEFHRN